MTILDYIVLACAAVTTFIGTYTLYVQLRRKYVREQRQYGTSLDEINEELRNNYQKGK